MQRFVVLAGTAALLAFSASAFAQGGGKAQAPRTAASLECSKQADAKGLHGKERKTFRAKCKRDMVKAKGGPAHGFR